MAASRMKVGYLGPSGTYTEDAARIALPGATPVPMPSIEAVFSAVQASAVDQGVVPFENVIHGHVTQTLDALYTYADSVQICDALVLDIEHALGARPGHAGIAHIYSHPQALHQCSRFLQSHYPDAQLHETASTVAAMQHIMEADLVDAAAIGSPRALARYGLHILAEQIGNSHHNKTRFVTLAQPHVRAAQQTGRDATALVIYPHRDRVGLLQGILTIISKDHGISCAAIQSRPDAQGAFRFFLEIEGHMRDSQVLACLRALRHAMVGAASDVKILGSFPRREFSVPRINTIGIVGGKGRMGQWFAHFFERTGFRVAICDTDGPLTVAQCAAQSDVILINVPIDVTVAVIAQIAPWMRPGQLLVDNTSVKTTPVAAMLAHAPAGVEVLGMHTVFGPGIGDQLLDENIIFVRTDQSGDMAHEFEAMFHKYGARIRHTTAEHHDKQMALHQNLEHFSKIVLAQLIRQTFPEPGSLDGYASPNSRATLATLGRVLSIDAHLHAELQTANPAGPQIIDRYVQVASDLAAAISRGERDVIEASVRASREYLGEELLAAMVERSKK